MSQEELKHSDFLVVKKEWMVMAAQGSKTVIGKQSCSDERAEQKNIKEKDKDFFLPNETFLCKLEQTIFSSGIFLKMYLSTPPQLCSEQLSIIQ